MASFDHSTPLSRDTASVASPTPSGAPRPTLSGGHPSAAGHRPTRTFIPASCHSDRPAWPCSEALLCHACYDLEFRASAFLIGARAAGFPVTETTARNMVVTLNSLALALHAPAEEQRAA